MLERGAVIGGFEIQGWLLPEAVLIDESGRAWLSDFGLTPGAATPAADRKAFAGLVRSCLGRGSVPRGRWETTSELIAAVAAERGGSPREGRHGRWRIPRWPPLRR